MKRSELTPRLNRFGLTMEVQSPGDGYSRYTFYKGGRRLGTVKGIRAAEHWLDGFAEGHDRTLAGY